MNLEHLTVLLPCQSLEDLSLRRDPDEAEALLSAWSALYHPALVHRAGSAPGWSRQDSPPSEPEGHLVIVPPCCQAEVPAQWLATAESRGARVIGDLLHREEIIRAALTAAGVAGVAVDSEIVGDFLALGFCHLQIELITRQLRYMSNLDEYQFGKETVAAAASAVEGDLETTREHLQGAFDLLTEAREYFYPVETHLVDLTLVAASTMGAALRRELAGGQPTNLLIGGRVLEEMAEREPETLAALKKAVAEGTARLIGGEMDDWELPLLPAEAILDQLQAGLEIYRRRLGRAPEIFGRRRFGLCPTLPQILLKLGFQGALHFTLDDGRFPHGNQSKINWEGVDGSPVDALVRLPLDAARAERFLELPEKLGDVMDLDHAATAVFAHWPGGQSVWYDDLRRMASYAPALGRFAEIEEYFRDTKYVGQTTQYPVDRYLSPYLRQHVAAELADPISRWVRYHGRRTGYDFLRSLRGMTALVRGTAPPGLDLEPPRPERSSPAQNEPDRAGEEWDSRWGQALEQSLAEFSRALPREDEPSRAGCLVVNPASFPRRVHLVGCPAEEVRRPGGPIEASPRTGGENGTVVEVPAMGFAWADGEQPASRSDESMPSGRTGKRKSKKGRWWRRRPPVELPPMAEAQEEHYALRNKFFEVKVDRTTGAIHSLHDYRSRDNRLAEQLALRAAPGAEGAAAGNDPENQYSVMAAEEIVITEAGPMVGEVVARGRLVDRRGQRLAGYEQVLRAWRGSRILEIEIELDVDRLPGGDPWRSYYGVRFAWSDPTVDVVCGTTSTGVATEASRLESPYYIDLRTEKLRTTILTAGLPFHQRRGLRKLDTLLVVRGERARRFRLGVGVDLPYPMPAALEMLAPRTIVAEDCAGPRPRSAWLLHVSARNVLVTAWEPICTDGRPTGIRARLLETEGRQTELSLTTIGKVKQAEKTDFRGEDRQPLETHDDRVRLVIRPREWLQVEVVVDR